MDTKNVIIQKLNNIVKDLSEEQKDIFLTIPSDKSNGDYSTNIAMQLSGSLKRNPREIANEIVENLNSDNIQNVEKIEIAGPGFINFFISNSIYTSSLINKLKDSKIIGKGKNLEGKRIMIEYAHPNPFKSFHIGHLRNITLGESLSRLLESQGAEIIRVNYQGDVGMHIAKCLWALKKVDESEYPETVDDRVKLLGKCYAEGASAYEEDQESYKEIREVNKLIYSGKDPQITKLWKLGKEWSLDKFHEIYNRVYSEFVREYMESEVMDVGLEKVQEALDKGVLKKSEGAVIFDGEPYGLETRVFLNSEGLPTYEGKELGLGYSEFVDYGELDLCIHNVAIEHNNYFKVTFKVQELLDPEMFAGKQYHNAYEFVGLKTGKMSSRKGQVVLGNDILNAAVEKVTPLVKAENKEEVAEMIGVGAVKYSFLKISPKTYLAFDLDESVNLEGDSGPYVMYTHARACSILDKFEGELEISEDFLKELNETEDNIIKHIYKFESVVEKATEKYAPNFITLYLYELSQLFNKFYNDEIILSDDKYKSMKKLLITKVVQLTLSKGLDLLAIKSPERI